MANVVHRLHVHLTPDVMSFNVKFPFDIVSQTKYRNGANSESVGERQMKWATEALLPTQSESANIWILLNPFLFMAPM